MNALVTFRSNAAGNLVASRDQRTEALQSISANFRARAEAAAGKSAAAAASKAAKSADGTAEKAASGTEEELDRDAFLNLLVMQMQYQDPLDPVDNTQMVSQLAEYSALEQMTNLNESFEDLAEQMGMVVGNIDQLNFISAQGLLGNYIEGVNIGGELTSGIVDSVTLDGSIVILSVGGDLVPMTGVLAVAGETPAEKAGGASPW